MSATENVDYHATRSLVTTLRKAFHGTPLGVGIPFPRCGHTRREVLGVGAAQDEGFALGAFGVGNADSWDDGTNTADAVGRAPVPPDTYALRLAPRTREPEYEALTLVVDRKTLQLRQLAATDCCRGSADQGPRSARQVPSR